MRGTDCTEEQLQSAREFLQSRRVDVATSTMPPDEQPIVIPFGKLANIVAWYGAIRYMAGKHGTGGTFEEPGPIDNTGKEAVDG